MPECAHKGFFWSQQQAREWLPQGGQSAALGSDWRRDSVAVDVSQHLAGQMVAAGASLAPLRSLLELGEQAFALAGRAVQLLGSYREHRFCGRCGGRNQALNGEHAMHCSACDHSYYPRLSPCAIMLVTRGEYCLLARHGGRGDYFTCLAGYVEPGEQVEQTVRREVREEVGVDVSRLSYFASQCWPFPGQLMLGFYAEYRDGDIAPDGVEIVEADWFHYSDLPQHPGPNTLSGQLIRGFVSRHRDSE
ncbi:MAG: NAD(+) diphosphatase [Porticoccaceae bacterium]|nr:NAD(+) diphosphatase [Porticoccaceae bacterium]